MKKLILALLLVLSFSDAFSTESTVTTCVKDSGSVVFHAKDESFSVAVNNPTGESYTLAGSIDNVSWPDKYEIEAATNSLKEANSSYQLTGKGVAFHVKETGVLHDSMTVMVLNGVNGESLTFVSYRFFTGFMGSDSECGN